MPRWPTGFDGFTRANDQQRMVGHLLLFQPAIVKMKALIDSGKVGKVQYIYVSIFQYFLKCQAPRSDLSRRCVPATGHSRYDHDHAHLSTTSCATTTSAGCIHSRSTGSA
jgi:predicted dehydrogenase